METATLIVGGGLSGLALAETLEAWGKDYLLVEARNRFGGRIASFSYSGAQFDMGPAWFWPGQPRIAALIDRLGLEVFPQRAQGAQTYEDETGQIQRGRGLVSMEGSWRLAGGFSTLTDGLASRLPAARKRLNAPVERLEQRDGRVVVTFAGGQALRANRVVLCMPPRLAANLAHDPPLEDTTRFAMEGIPTWMAGQAKVMAIYQKPFWREMGLSGDAASRTGPMVEVHDASPADGSLGALFGFVGLPVPLRRDVGRLRPQVLAQLGRLFGAAGATPVALDIKDWAYDPMTATGADATGPSIHPAYGLSPAMTGLWGNRLILSGTETAPRFGGFIEGALEAAEMALQTLSPRQNA